MLPTFSSAIAILVLIGWAWLGLKLRAPRLPMLKGGQTPSNKPLPDSLPAPVKRYAQALYGDSVPDVRSAILQGRARLAPTGVSLPTRFRFYYDAADPGYYHDIRVTWWGRGILRIHERLRDGETVLDLSILGRVENEPKINRAGLQGFWAEVLAWIPAIALLDTRIQWQAIDATSARMILPGLDEGEAFTVRFDAETGLLTEVEARRWADAGDESRKRWRNRVLRWEAMDGSAIPAVSETQWDDDKPWATWEIDQIVLNADVSARMSQFKGDV